MISVKNNQKGRFGNKFIRNMVMYIINSKHNIIPIYELDNQDIDSFKRLGINFKINNPLSNMIKEKISSNKIIKLLDNSNSIDSSRHYILDGFYQDSDIIKYIYQYFNNPNNNLPINIIDNNPYKTRYNNNNDIFIHLRAGDIFNNGKKVVPNLKYYESIINFIKDYNNIYIASDNFNNFIYESLSNKFKIIKYDSDKIDTIQFGSTCKYIILSSGSFSLVISFLSFYSKNIFFSEDMGAMLDKKRWHPDFFESLEYEKLYL